MNIDSRDRKEQRKFGLSLAGLFVVLCAIAWWRHGEVRVWMLAAAGVFLLTGLVAPPLLGPLLAVWLRIAGALNWIVTHVLLTVSFWALIVPTGIIIRRFGDDPLKRRWEPERSSYWEEPDAQPADLEAYKNQF